jgi:Zn-dependent protease/CBS domain-containing protein
MRRIRVGSVFQIPIQLDVTFLLILPAFAWIIGTQITDTAALLNQVGATLDADLLANGGIQWVLGITSAVGLFVGVILHELGHSLVARRFGFQIESITLWLFGGIANLEEMPEDWHQELQIAVAGPIVSLLVGGVAFIALVGLTRIPGSESVAVQSARFVVGYLAVLNVALAGFNMLPGFPMDGGRVLRALLARRRTYARATEIAAEVGKLFAIALGLFGLFVLGNIFLAGLAFFIYIGAESESKQTMMKAAFEGITVADVMTPGRRVTMVEPNQSVRELMEIMFRERHTGYPVAADGELVGLVTLEDARAVRDVERDAYTVSDIMTTEILTVRPDEEVMSAFSNLNSNAVGRLFVMEDEQFRGLLTRSDIMDALSIIKSSSGVGDESEEAAVYRPQS